MYPRVMTTRLIFPNKYSLVKVNSHAIKIRNTCKSTVPKVSTNDPLGVIHYIEENIHIISKKVNKPIIDDLEEIKTKLQGIESKLDKIIDNDSKMVDPKIAKLIADNE